jgi:hypothetical protein
MRVMRQQQPPGGKIFLVDGQGSNGRATPKNAAYGATKAALVQLKVVHPLTRCCHDLLLNRAGGSDCLSASLEHVCMPPLLLTSQAAGSMAAASEDLATASGPLCVVRVLQASLAAQVRGSSTSVHLVSPGMVATDLLAASVRSEALRIIASALVWCLSNEM